LEKDFKKIQGDICTLYIHKDYRNESLEHALLAGEKHLQQDFELQPIVSSSCARVYKFNAVFKDEATGLYYKQYFPRTVRDRIRYFFGSSRSKRAFEAGLMLKENGFEAPFVIAIGRYGNGLFDRTDFVVTLEAENTKPIAKHIPDNIQNLNTEDLRDYRTLIHEFGRTIGKMHARGIFHGDLRLGNILAGKFEGKWRFFFLDNERTRKFIWLRPRLRLKNLVQVNMILTKALMDSDRWRFFRCYLDENPDIRRSRKIWAHKIIKKTRYRMRNKHLT
jgi:hypothetical protein